MLHHISKRTFFLIAAGSIIFNILALVFIFAKEPEIPNKAQNLRSRFVFLSPRVFVENPNDRLVNFVPLRKTLTEYHKKTQNHLGIYFEYLPSGVSIGLNDRENFVSASLLKTPLVMGVYKQIELGKINKNDILTIRKEYLDSAFGDLWKKGEGAQLSVFETIKIALIESDNTAKNLLFASVPEGTLEDVFDSLDIPKELESDQAVVTPKNYSSILRSLYLASYLSEENSNEILNILTQTPFNDKLAAGVPDDIKVAHKFGVHLGSDDANAVFTDCGIVYAPKRPYILCIMTKTNETMAIKEMKEISKIVYDYISQANYAKSNK